MLSFSATDNRDGTGVTIEVSGSAGDTQLFTSQFSGKLQTAPFVESHEFSEDGSAVIGLESGSYLAVAKDGAGYTAPKRFRVSNEDEAVHFRCVYAIRDFMLDLVVPGLPTSVDRHKVHKRAKRTVQEFSSGDSGPYGVHYWPAPETRRTAYNRVDDVEYLVEVIVINGADGDNTLDNEWLLGREVMGKSFGQCPLPGVPEVHTVLVTPGVIYAPSSTVDIDVQSMTFRCQSEQGLELV